MRLFDQIRAARCSCSLCDPARAHLRRVPPHPRCGKGSSLRTPLPTGAEKDRAYDPLLDVVVRKLDRTSRRFWTKWCGKRIGDRRWFWGVLFASNLGEWAVARHALLPP